ncbi:cytochrome c oxidase assembly protein COX11, mitochondrial-like isoform X2 [Acanthaster planci]|nr:cytochrome c oxidase assembly protein COX11, mitochondrial-like isoform X2 [Acanthaster planci]
MARGLGRLFVLPFNSAGPFSSCLLRRNFHSLGNTGRLFIRTCLSDVPRNTCIARTKTLCLKQGNSGCLSVSNILLGTHCRFCHVWRNDHRSIAKISSWASPASRTLPGGGFKFASPGFVRAANGSLLRCCLISSGQREAWQHRNKSVMFYGVALVILVIGFSYAAVPLYTVFCQATGLGGQATKGHNIDLVEDMLPVRGRPISVRFNADTAASMRWNFRPQQLEIKVVPGETALAFYSALNPTDKPITGISTYNVVPFEAGQYFNKIQCFCFEEQRLNPREQVDMPVFFYIDPEFAEDPKMAKVDTITLSYTFFEAKEGLVLPDPFTKPVEAKA